VEDWLGRLDEHGPDGWPWEDLIDKANHLFERMIAFDMSLREAAFSDKLSGEAEYVELDSKLGELFRSWLRVSERIAPLVSQFRREFIEVDGEKAFLQNVERAQGMATPDDQFFVADKLVELRDSAVDAVRSGDVEPMFDDAGDQ